MNVSARASQASAKPVFMLGAQLCQI